VCPSSRIDISDQVRRRLPPPLLAALNDVEGVYQRPIPFYLVQDLPVNAGGLANSQGFVELLPHSRSNLNVIGEEIMHLHRWTTGYPLIRPSARARGDGYDHHLQALGGHFDEYAFFPFLEQAGLNPRAELYPRIVDAVRDLHGGLLDRIPRVLGSGEFTLEWRVKLSRTYVVASSLSGPSPARDTLLQLFEAEPLHPCAELGRRIALEIADASDETPDQVADRMRTCLFTHLGLPQNAATVRYLDPRDP